MMGVKSTSRSKKLCTVKCNNDTECNIASSTTALASDERQTKGICCNLINHAMPPLACVGLITETV